MRNCVSQVWAATQSIAQSRAGDVGRGDVGCRKLRLRKMWVSTYGDAGWKNVVDGLVK